MEEKLAAGFSRDGLPVFLDLSFLDGQRGAHVNISGVSGVATKTSYASFLLFSLFGSGILGHEAANTKAISAQGGGRPKRRASSSAIQIASSWASIAV